MDKDSRRNNCIEDRLRGKRVLIWGHGLEGKSAEAFLQAHGNVSALDVYEGAQSGIDEAAYDYIIKSPGIRENHWNGKYTSVTELFLQEFGSQTVGITGTKGKSTTASLLYQVLKAAQKRPVVLVGNIGIPCLDAYEEIGDDTIIVFELSCHQLDHLRVSPHLAVFLNLYEEHLDRYDTMERYFEAKKGITIHQGANDIFYTGPQVPAIETAAETRVIDAPAEGAYALKLSGAHNQYNAHVVYTIATEQFGCDPAAAREVLAAFTGLPHRMQYLGSKNGIKYYDDSISTIPEAAIAALESVENAKTVLIGGMDRGIRYDILENYMREHPEFEYICMYDSGKRIYDAVAPLAHCHYREDLAGAVALAKERTPQGGACILSPAAASYGYFRNFEERGDIFASLVLQ